MKKVKLDELRLEFQEKLESAERENWLLDTFPFLEHAKGFYVAHNKEDSLILECSTLQGAIDAMEHIKPELRKYTWKDTFIYVNHDAPEKENVREINPVHLCVKPNFTAEAEFRYYINGRDRVIEICVRLPLHLLGVSVHARWINQQNRAQRCESSSLSLGSLKAMETVKLGRGSDEYMNDFYVFFDKDKDIIEMVKGLEESRGA